MRGFWLPIGLRAAAVFAIGMTLYGFGRYLKHHTHFHDHGYEVQSAEVAAASEDARVSAMRAAEHAMEASINAGLAAKSAKLGAMSSLADFSRSKTMPPDFILDGTRVGSLVRLKGSRDARDTRAHFLLTVRLDPSRKAAGCDLVPINPDDFELDQGFRCISAGETGLIPVGSVRFEPGGTTREIRGSTRMAEELAKGDPFAIDADLTGPMNLMVNGKGGERVRLQSDSQHTALVVHDERGKEVVRMQAGKDGFAIIVDTTDH